MRRMRGVVAALAAGLGLFWLVSAQASYIVQVGYADGIRGSPNFPNPWFGSPGVSFFGHFAPPDDVGADAGAIRIINNGGTDITIDAFTVDGFANGASFTIWGGFLPAVIHPGDSGIFTETSFNDFDSSDQPITPFATSAEPVVHVTVDGVLSDFTDVGQVLNTGGFDLALFGINESLGWRPITSTCGINCPGNQTPEPATLGLLGLALAAMGVVGGRRRKK